MTTWRRKDFVWLLILFLPAIIIGYGGGVVLNAGVRVVPVFGPWFARETSIVASAGPTEPLAVSSLKEASPPTVFVEHSQPHPAISPEEEILPRPVPIPTPAPVVLPLAATAPVVVAPVAEPPWINILPREDFLRGQSFRRFVPFEGKTYEEWYLAVSLRPGTQIRTPFAGRASATGRGLVDGKWHGAIYVEGVFNGTPTHFVILAPGLLLKSATPSQWGVVAETTSTDLPFEGRYGVLIYFGTPWEKGMFANDPGLLWEFFPHAKPVVP